MIPKSVRCQAAISYWQNDKPKITVSLHGVPRDMFDAMPGMEKEYYDDIQKKPFWTKRMTTIITVFCDQPKEQKNG